jgi:hypothetical protein
MTYSLVTDPGQLVGNVGTIDWAQEGGQLTILQGGFTAVSTNGVTVTAGESGDYYFLLQNVGNIPGTALFDDGFVTGDRFAFNTPVSGFFIPVYAADNGQATITEDVYDGSVLEAQYVISGNSSYSDAPLGVGAAGGPITNVVFSTVDGSGTPEGMIFGAISIVAAPSQPVTPEITSASVNTELTLDGTAADDSSVDVYEDGTLVGSAPADGNGNWSYTTLALDDGHHTFTAYPSGNTQSASNNVVLAATISSMRPPATRCHRA